MKVPKIIKNNSPRIYGILVNIRNYIYKFSSRSFSQFGEDLVLFNFFNRSEKGFYIDIGAYHPYKFSNTYFYYRRGWQGINIDARPGSMKIFKQKRPRDINLEAGISCEEKPSDFYVFEDYAFNTFSKDLADVWQNKGFKIKKTIQVETKRLENILAEYLPQDKDISFMSVDVEGLDLLVLQSNNWLKYRPRFILVEIHNFNLENFKESEVYNFLIEKGYELVSIVYITLIFKRKD